MKSSNNFWRVQNFQSFKGKKEIIQNLKIFIASAKQKNCALDHILLCGLPGTGKTSLANIIANEFGSNIKIIQGSSLQKPSDIINIALSLKQNDFLFIDEIHAVEKHLVELLYSIMEDFSIDITIGKEFNSKVTRIQTPSFTLIGATTNMGKIIQPLEDRFPIKFTINEYSILELSEIIKQNSKKLKMNLDSENINLIANNAKGIPRIANNILKRVNDYYLCKKGINIKTILKKIGIIHNGIDLNDLNYLRLLENNKSAVGLKTLSQLLGYDNAWIESKIEPFLLKNNYILKTSKGRLITNKGISLVKKLANF